MNKAVVQDYVGMLNCLHCFEGQEVGVARTGTDQPKVAALHGVGMGYSHDALEVVLPF